MKKVSAGVLGVFVRELANEHTTHVDIKFDWADQKWSASCRVNVGDNAIANVHVEDEPTLEKAVRELAKYAARVARKHT